ncbi:hypothetical protein [Parabacteroides sp.]
MRTAQVVKCKCGSIIAACIAPACYEDKDWQNDIRDFIEHGYTTEELACDGSWKLGECECTSLPVKMFTKKNIKDAFLNYCDEQGMFEDEALEAANDFIDNFLVKMYLENKRQLEIQF